MRKQLCLVGLLLPLASCSRRVPLPEPPRPAEPKVESVPSRTLPVRPAPPRDDRLPRWELPRWKAPDGNSWQPPRWEPYFSVPRWSPGALEWDRRFDRWHWDDLRPTAIPRFEARLEYQMNPKFRVTDQEVFGQIHIPVMNFQSVLDDYYRQQKENAEKYDEFPIPVNLQIPF